MTGSATQPRARRPKRRTALLIAWSFCGYSAPAQTVAFEFQTYPDCPFSVVNYSPATLRIGPDRRQFVTVKNESGKAAAAIVFQQTVSTGSKTEIVSLERVSIVITPREKKRLSVSVFDLLNRLQIGAASGETIAKPVLSVVAVEFNDGTLWTAPTGRPSPALCLP